MINFVPTPCLFTDAPGRNRLDALPMNLQHALYELNSLPIAMLHSRQMQIISIKHCVSVEDLKAQFDFIVLGSNQRGAR